MTWTKVRLLAKGSQNHNKDSQDQANLLIAQNIKTTLQFILSTFNFLMTEVTNDKSIFTYFL